MNILTLDCETGNFLNSDGSVAGNFNDFLDPTGGQAEFCKDYVSTSTDTSKLSIFANNGPAIYNDGRWENTNPTILSNRTINDCLTKVGDKICCYASFSLPANIVFPKDEGYSEYKEKTEAYLGTGGNTSANDIYAFLGKIPFNDYLGIILDYFPIHGIATTLNGFVAFDYTKYGGTYDTWVSGSKKLHLAGGIEQFGEGVHVDVGAFGESEQKVFVKHVFECTSLPDNSHNHKTGKLTTTLYSSDGIKLAEVIKSFSTSSNYNSIGWRIGTVDSYNHFIAPGIKWYQVVLSTDDLDIKEFIPNRYRKYLDGDGLAVAWDITKNWVNKHKQDKLTAGNNITIEGNVISAAGGESVDLSDYAKKSEIPDVSNLAKKSEIPDISGLQPKLTAGNNITIENNVISSSGSGGSIDLSNYYTKAEVDYLLSQVISGGFGTLLTEPYENVPNVSNTVNTYEELSNG